MAERSKTLGRKKTANESFACQRALNTFELLESTLLYLDNPVDLRTARLVSKSWSAVITRSQVLNVRWKINNRRLIKMLMIGHHTSGKRALVLRWVLNIFVAPDPTPCIEDSYRTQATVDNVKSMFEILCVHACPVMVQFSLRDANCYALVYSSTSRQTFESIPSVHRDILAYLQDQKWLSDIVQPKIPKVLVGLIATKQDVPDHERQVSEEEGEALAHELNCPFYETSAKTAYGCKETFDNVVRTCRERIYGFSVAGLRQRPQRTGKRRVWYDPKRRESIFRRLLQRIQRKW